MVAFSQFSFAPVQEIMQGFGRPSVCIHEHCTVAEILVFGRETGFPTQTLQRWYMYKSPQGMETNLINVCQHC
jgi:hypothetical protein